ncbi:MAG: MBL fold metallo-hydrolase [Candidatus Omnitrophica bacterium]|nr:MBL fold metallo-hydrolase [Candidatus Omnitrophota bacterium]
MGFIKFLGTAGARFVMIRQLRSCGGIWLNYKSTNVIIDPGPGSLVRCALSKPKLDPSKLDAIILTHKHLDHSADVNVMIEAMTEGGFKRRGVLFLPEDAIGEDGVIFSYLKNYVEKIVFLKEDEFFINDLKFCVPIKNQHPVQTYGLKFYIDKEIVSIVSDTDYFEDLVKAYKDSTILILNVVFYEKKADIQHLSFDEALYLAKKINPKTAIFTHFGMTMLKAKPHKLEEDLRQKSPLTIKFAYDGLTVKI